MFDVHPELKCVIQLHEGAYKNFRKDDRKVDIPLITLSDAQWEETRKGLYAHICIQKMSLFTMRAFI